MAAKDSHGVVVVRVRSRTIHRGDSGHFVDAVTNDDWELFPNRHVAEGAGYTKLCQGCFHSELRHLEQEFRET